LSRAVGLLGSRIRILEAVVGFEPRTSALRVSAIDNVESSPPRAIANVAKT